MVADKSTEKNEDMTKEEQEDLAAVGEALAEDDKTTPEGLTGQDFLDYQAKQEEQDKIDGLFDEEERKNSGDFEISEVMNMMEQDIGTKSYHAGGYDEGLKDKVAEKIGEDEENPGKYKSDEIGGEITRSGEDSNLYHYKGSLGEFDYDPDDWSVTTKEISNDTTEQKTKIPVLRYIGSGSGKSVEIPEGVKVLDYSFEGLDISEVPVIPKGVESCHCSFMNCKELYRASGDAKEGENFGPAGPIGGTWEMPDSIKDASGMFYNCGNLCEAFTKCSSDLVNAQYMYGYCGKLGQSTYWQGFSEHNTNAFTSFADSNYMTEDNSNSAYTGANADAVKPFIDNDYTDEKGNKVNCRRGRYVDDDGKVNAKKAEEFDSSSKANSELASNVANQSALKNALGYNGVSNDVTAATDDIASSIAFIDKDGSVKYSDNSDADNFETKSASMINILDRIGVSAAEFGIAKLVTRNTWIAAGITAGGQLLGVLPSSLKPILDTVKGFAGEDSQIGKALGGISEKLDTAQEVEKTKNNSNKDVHDLTAASTGDRLENTLKDPMNAATGAYTKGIGLDANYQKQMEKHLSDNGNKLVRDNVILTVANQGRDSKELQQVSILMDDVTTTLEMTATNAAKDGKLDDNTKKDIANKYMSIIHGLDAYDDGIQNGISSVYHGDAESQARGNVGLSTLNDLTVGSVYGSLKSLETQYGDILSDEQRKELDSLQIRGVESYSDYTPDASYDSVTGLSAEEEAYANAGIDDALESTDDKSASATGSLVQRLKDKINTSLGKTDNTKKTANPAMDRGSLAEQKFGSVEETADPQADASMEY